MGLLFIMIVNIIFFNIIVQQAKNYFIKKIGNNFINNMRIFHSLCLSTSLFLTVKQVNKYLFGLDHKV